MRKMKLALILVVLLISISSAGQVSEKTYSKHNISFQIPENWSVNKDAQSGNDTQIVLSDGISAIRIDLITSSNQTIDQLVLEYLKREKTIPGDSSYSSNWRLIYGLVPWQANGAIGYYYKNNIIKPVNNLGCLGSGISIKPDGVDQASIYESCDQPPAEWLIAWTKPEYKEEIVGIHALFSGNYQQIPFEWHGSSRNYTIQQPLWLMLTTFANGDKPKASSLIERV